MDVRAMAAVTLLAVLPAAGFSDDIVTWTDAHGVTHFGNARLAPTTARPVDVEPANGMAVPELPPGQRRSGSRGPVTVVLEKEPNRETIGWRGHQWNVGRRGHR